MKLKRITPRERDLIRLGALGLSDKAIASELKLSANSVKVYLSTLRRKIGHFDRALLPGLGLLLGFVSIADVTRGALRLLQARCPDLQELPAVEHEGAD